MNEIFSDLEKNFKLKRIMVYWIEYTSKPNDIWEYEK